MAAALWLHLLLRDRVAAGVRLGACGVSLAVAALVVAVAWSEVPDRFSQSALAHAAPGGKSLRVALDRLWSPPPLAAGTPAGERALEEHWPDAGAVAVIASPDLGIEILMRSGRSNALPFGDPLEDSFVPEERLPLLAAAARDLKAGDRLLLDSIAWATLTAYMADPPLDPLETTGGAPGRLVNVQRWLLARIARDFEVRAAAREPGGFVIAVLSPRSP
jgi:hypothetical protein